MSDLRVEPVTGLASDLAVTDAGSLTSGPTRFGRGTRERRRRQRPSFGTVLFWLAAAWLTVVIMCAVFADLLPIASYSEPVGSPSTPPGFGAEFLGTDGLGRSELSRVIYGARVSLAVALLATATGVALGTALGLLAAYFGGVADKIVEVLAGTALAIPPLVFLMALVAALDPSMMVLVVGLAALTVPSFARLARANAIAVSSREYVIAARSLGAGHGRILLRELLPNTLPAILSYSVVVSAGLIVAEGSLSYLGLGIPPPHPSWGSMIAAAQPNLASAPWPVLTPCLAIFLTVLALNTVGDRLQRHLGTRTSQL